MNYLEPEPIIFFPGANNFFPDADQKSNRLRNTDVNIKPMAPPLTHLLCLLEEDIVEDPRDVNVDIVLHRLEHVHVGLHRVEQLAGLGYLTRLRAVSTIGIWSTSMVL